MSLDNFVLEMKDGRLQLRDTEAPEQTPLSVDFLSGNIQHRRKFGLSKNQPLAKAVGLQKMKSPLVLDVTAGLGVDAFFLACLGCRVVALERSPLVFKLLEDGLRRAHEAAAEDEELAEILSRFLILNEDALSFFSKKKGSKESVDQLLNEINDTGPDTIYVDPMYPESKKSALPKKGMQIFRRLIGEDKDVEEVVRAALTVANERVVLKRHLKAPYLIGKPAFSYEGKTVRYDLYSPLGD